MLILPVPGHLYSPMLDGHEGVDSDLLLGDHIDRRCETMDLLDLLLLLIRTAEEEFAELLRWLLYL